VSDRHAIELNHKLLSYAEAVLAAPATRCTLAFGHQPQGGR